ncbi:hypothetical protein TNCV_2190392 [Trichonephila clavipes]|uniref:Uncharacterized protein n=1 Tax=Trichonephila clavipes TaxID=2585209 RepID=A0A8X6UU47_TRICX|nr:hypothetical protein TNCV_2190392 [Trichonephila clavipes]
MAPANGHCTGLEPKGSWTLTPLGVFSMPGTKSQLLYCPNNSRLVAFQEDGKETSFQLLLYPSPIPCLRSSSESARATHRPAQAIINEY